MWWRGEQLDEEEIKRGAGRLRVMTGGERGARRIKGERKRRRGGGQVRQGVHRQIAAK